ncbi:MAG: hypothetical protein R2801_01035 [Chitinophagales bacterium]
MKTVLLSEMSSYIFIVYDKYKPVSYISYYDEEFNDFINNEIVPLMKKYNLEYGRILEFIVKKYNKSYTTKLPIFYNYKEIISDSVFAIKPLPLSLIWESLDFKDFKKMKRVCRERWYDS